MSLRLVTLVAITLAFALLTTLALAKVGLVGIFQPHFTTWGGAQVFIDLVILAVLGCTWMLRDAAARGLPAWPFILLTLLAGSFGPLLYLIVRELRKPARA